MMAPLADRVERVSVLPGGLVNANLRVETPAGVFVLRVYRLDPAACGKEAALLRRMAGTVPVPRLRHAEPDGPAPYLVMDWVPGERLVDVLPEVRDVGPLMERLGALLARVHDRRFDRCGFLDAALAVRTPFDSADAAWRGFLEGALCGDAGRLLGAARPALERVLAGERIGRDPPVLLHADFKPTNVLVRRDPWRIAAILDWEFAWSGPACFDLGQLLRHAHRYAPDYEAGAWSGYASVRALPSDAARQARLLDLMNLVGFLDDGASRPRMARDVRRLLDRSLDALGYPVDRA